MSNSPAASFERLEDRLFLSVSGLIQTDQDLYETGQPMQITLQLQQFTDEGLYPQPVLSASILAQVTPPGLGAGEQFMLEDDGLHNDGPARDGIYGGTFTQTYWAGNYDFNFWLLGDDLGGNSFELVQQRWVGAVTGSDADGDGLGDVLEQHAGTNVNAADSDADGLRDQLELITDADPLADDADLTTIVLGDLNPASLTFLDSDGSKVVLTHKGGLATIRLSGQNIAQTGTAKAVTVTGSQLQVMDVQFTNTTDASKFSATAKGGDGAVTIGEFWGSQAVGKISGPIDLLAGLHMADSGYVGTIGLRDMLAGSNITMEGSPAAGVSISAGKIAVDTEITLAGGVKSFSVGQVDGLAMRASWASAVTVKAVRARSLTGDMLAEMQLTGAGVAVGKPTLGKLSVDGILAGDWSVTGLANSVAVKNRTQNWTGRFHGSATSLTLGQVDSSTLQVDDAIASLTALVWTGGQIEADSVKTLKITGGRGYAGDLDCPLNLHGAADDGLTLGSGSIARRVNDPMLIEGDVGSLKVGSFSDDIDILGDAGKVSVGQPLALMSPPAWDASHRISVAGQAPISGTNGKFLIAGGELYASQVEMYRLEDLRQYDMRGRYWDYDVSYKGTPGRGTGSTRISVAPDMAKINGVDNYMLSSDTGGGRTSIAWRPVNSAMIASTWRMRTYDGSLDIQFFFDNNWRSVVSSGLTDGYIGPGRKTSVSTSLTGSQDIINGDVHTSADIDGTITVTMSLLGHEWVTDAYGYTYLAAKIGYDFTMSGAGDVEAMGYHAPGKLKVTNRQVLWAVPEIGVVKMIDTMSISMSTTGMGSDSVTATSTMLLRDMGTIR